MTIFAILLAATIAAGATASVIPLVFADLDLDWLLRRFPRRGRLRPNLGHAFADRRDMGQTEGRLPLYRRR